MRALRVNPQLTLLSTLSIKMSVTRTAKIIPVAQLPKAKGPVNEPPHSAILVDASSFAKMMLARRAAAALAEELHKQRQAG
jgi:hypothetical protein